MRIMPVKRLVIRVYVHATESRDKVLKVLENIVGRSLLSRAEIREESYHGHYGNPIRVIEVVLRNENAIGLLGSIFSRLSRSDLLLLDSSIEERVDKEGTLFFRLSKQDAYMGNLSLYEADDVVRISVFFSGRRSKAVEEYRRMFREGAGDR